MEISSVGKQLATSFSEPLGMLESTARVLHQDIVTGLPNKNYFEKNLEYLWLQQAKKRACLSIILCDIEDFNAYDQTLGSLQTKIYLKDITLALNIALPPKNQDEKTDYKVLTRYGQDRFAILLANMYIDETLNIAEAMLGNIRQLNLSYPTTQVDLILTASFGIASVFPAAVRTKEDFLLSAESALDQAKQYGGDAVFALPPKWAQLS